jgi:hypothetical protein
MPRLLAAVSVGGLLLASSSVLQADDIVKAVTANDIAAVLKAAGYPAEVIAATSRPHVKTMMGGTNVFVLPADCAGDACSTLQFWVGFKKSSKFTVSFVEGWNSDRRLTKAHLTKDGGMHFEYDIDLRGGVSSTYLRQAVLTFDRMLTRMDEAIKAAPAGGADVISRAREADILVAEGKFMEAANVLDDATLGLWLKSPLRFRSMLWLDKPADGYGLYKKRDTNVFSAGDQMFAYAEPFGYNWRKVGDVWQIEFAADLEIRDKANTVVFRQREFMNTQMQSAARNREFMTNFTYRFTDIPNGEYVADTTIRDRVSGKSATFSLPFVIR